MDTGVSQYKEVFINESKDIITNSNQLLIKLEKNPAESSLINETFRLTHNLKGMSATMGFEKITKLSHELENILDLVRKGEKQLNTDLMNMLFNGLDSLEILVNGLKKEPLQTLTPLEEFSKPTTLRIDVKILDDLVNLIGELVISKNKLQECLSQYNNNELDNAFYNLNKLIADLENTILKTRIVPIDYIFSRFPRMVRDLTIEYKKEINFVIEGKDIGLDRGILDELYEPLIHILRNAVYHGIELPEIRRKLNKNSTGKITLSARKEENYVIIEVEDDGSGIDIDKVKATALKNGLIKQSELDILTNKECYYLLTLPGFTTVSGADKTAGRGVGLDVVKTKIESLNGSLTINSAFKKGSKLTLKVPLTLAIIQSLIVNICNEIYAIPFSVVKEVFSIKTPTDGKVDYKGKSIPLIKLKDILDIQEDSASGEKEVLIVNYKNKEFGIEISKIKSQHEIVVKPISKLLNPSKIFSGATILGNGKVALILDLNAIIVESEVKK